MAVILCFALLCAALPSISRYAVPRCLDVDGPYDVAVVLGGSMTYKGILRDDTMSRVMGAVSLYDYGVVGSLFMSGGGNGPHPRSVGEVMTVEAEALGVPAQALGFEGRSLSTLENARFSAAALPRDHSLIVVTEPWHALRGAASFVWAGRPSAVCATEFPNERSAEANSAFRRRESAAWAVNIGRASVWSFASLLRLESRLPDWFLE